jgi:hypothetical protein
MKTKIVPVVSLALLLCSCSTKDSSPEKRYLGQWKATHAGEQLGVRIEPNQRCVLTEDSQAWAGKWVIQAEEITITTENEVVRGFINSDGDLVLREGEQSEAVVFKKEK